MEDMPTEIICKSQRAHKGNESIYEAAKCLAEKGSLPLCEKRVTHGGVCGEPRSMKMRQEYPWEKNPPKTHEYDVIKVVRLFSRDEEAKIEHFDPMIFVMRESDEKKTEYLWFPYWTESRNGNFLWGQFPPMLTIDQLQQLMKKLAYSLIKD